MPEATDLPEPDGTDQEPGPVTGSAPQQAETPEASTTPDDVVDVSAVVTPPES